MKSLTKFLLPLALLTAGTANAATLQIQFTGLDLFYDDSTQTVCDATSCLGGGGNLADADALVEVEFLVDNVLVGSLNTNIGADIQIGLDSYLDWFTPTFDIANVTGGYFDILMNATTGWGLGLDVQSGGISIVTDLAGTKIASFGGLGIVGAVCGAACPENPSLPFGLTPGDLFSISWSSEIFAVDGYDFYAAGTGEVSGNTVPEPGSLALLGLGLIGIAAARRRVIKS